MRNPLIKRSLIIVGLICIFLYGGQLAYSGQGHFWDEVVFTSFPMGSNEQVQVHARLTQGGWPSFEFLEINVGEHRINVPEDLLKKVDFPDLGSFLLVSEKVEGKRVIYLSVSPQWKGPIGTRPGYSFEISDGRLRSMSRSTGGKVEFLWRE